MTHSSSCYAVEWHLLRFRASQEKDDDAVVSTPLSLSSSRSSCTGNCARCRVGDRNQYLTMNSAPRLTLPVRRMYVSKTLNLDPKTRLY
jgi:hypothetical protein